MTAACMVMRREVFEQFGRFDERYRVAFNDVDLCLRMRQAGYAVVYQPHASSTTTSRGLAVPTWCPTSSRDSPPRQR